MLCTLCRNSLQLRSKLNVLPSACLSTKYVPSTPQWIKPKTNFTKVTMLSKEDQFLLESLSLVKFKHIPSEVQALQDAINYASALQDVPTDDVEPLTCVLEDMALYLRDDEVTVAPNEHEVLSNAKVTLEDYFVAPPGNISLEDD